MKLLIMTVTALMSVFGVSAETSPNSSEAKVLNATQNKYQAGLHYDLINPAWPGRTEEPVVYEFFSYMCPGCNAFEPIMQELKGQISETQTIIRVPVAFYSQWEPHAKAYHALQMMGELEQAHEALFAAIHKFKKPLRTLPDIAAWLSNSFAIDEQKFLSTAQSFAVDAQIRKDKQMVKAMGIGTVPTLVVNGRFKLNFDQLKTPANILDATVQLLNQH
jgi:thiol:disulfide interchange protein DsbA